MARRRLVVRALEERSWPELLEVPEGLGRPHTYGEYDEYLGLLEAAARRVALEWQLSSPQLLLLARVCDTLDAILRPFDERDGRNYLVWEQHPVAVLRPMPTIVQRIAPRLFPWRVVVEAGRPAPMREMLRAFAESYGIAVHVAKGRQFARLWRCTHANGRDGTVGGVLHLQTGPGGLTCGHVVSASCPSVQLRAMPERHAWSPDAALVHLDGSCLPIPDAGRVMTPVSFGDAEELSLDHAAVCLNTDGRCRTGYLNGVTLSASDREGPLRFPSVLISRERTTVAGVPWPLFSRAFSRPGDSGAWVTLHADSDLWVAMVVSGDNKGQSIGHLAGPLLRWLQVVNSGQDRPAVSARCWFDEGASSYEPIEARSTRSHEQHH